VRILHTNMHVGGWGGQANRILVVCKGLRDRGYDVIVAAPKNATLVERAREAGLEVFDDWYLPKKFSFKRFFLDLVAILKLMKDRKIKLVHTHGSQDGWVASIAAKLIGGIKVLRTRHNIFPVKTHIFNKLLYRFLTDKLIAISFAVFDVYKKNGVLGKKLENVEVIYDALDLDKYSNCEIDRKEVEDTVGDLDRNFVIVNIGRLAKEKAQDFLVEAIASLKGFLKVRAVILGEGPLYDKLKELVLERGIGDKVIFGGLRKNVASFLKYSDIFVFTSLSEGLGTSLIEAGYFGLPVVAFKVGGIPEVVVDGKSGLLVECGDVTDLANNIRKLLFLPRIRRRMGMNGRKRAIERFNPDQLVEGNIRVYNSIINR